MPAPAEPAQRPKGPAGAANPGGSHVPASDDLAAARRLFERHGGDHVARYRWAASHLRDARVLDVGCGHGFGALFLRGAYREYVGLDLDAPAVKWANRVVAPAAPGATFVPSDQVPRDSRYDAVTCFEVIEHVSDPRRLLSGLQTALAPGARVFLSTPNGLLSAGRPEWYMSPYHLAEYTAREFQEIVAASFPDEGEFFAQRRFDGLDWILPALRGKLRGGAGRAGRAAPTGVVTTPGGMKRAHEAFRRFPSPPAIWRMHRLRPPMGDPLRASHLLWTGRAGPS